MWKKILGGLVALIAIFLVVVAMQPSQLHIERTAVIAAPPEVVFAQVNHPRKSTAWSPWSKLDPAMTKTFEGPEEGVGAVYKWSGNDQVGEGTMTLVESQPNTLVKFTLAFTRPMADVSSATYTLKPEGNGTSLTWSLDSEQGFMEKAVCLFMDLDAMLGAQFEEGFAELKKVVEKPA